MRTDIKELRDKHLPSLKEKLAKYYEEHGEYNEAINAQGHLEYMQDLAKLPEFKSEEEIAEAEKFRSEVARFISEMVKGK